MCMGPPSDSPLQEHVDGIDGRNNLIGSSSTVVVLRQDDSVVDPDLDCLLSELQNDVDQQDVAACFSTSSTCAHSVCNAQPCVYKRFPSLTHTYPLPPFADCEVVQLQCLPLDPGQHADLAAPSTPAQRLHADMAATPTLPPYARPAADRRPPYFFTPHLPPHPSLSHLASHVNMPPHQPSPTPPAYSNFNTHQFGAAYHQHLQFSYSNIGLPKLIGSPTYDPENSFSFGFGSPREFPSLHIHGEASAVGAASLRNTSTMEMEINHKNIYCHQDTQFFSLRNPNYNMYSDQQSFTKSAGLSGLNVCASPTSRPFDGDSSLAYMQSSHSTRAAAALDPAAVEIPRVSTPTSTSPFYQTNSNILLSERKSVSVTPSVNKEMRSSTAHDGDQVAFRVKTEILNLHDGFIWKKYGEKTIKKKKHVRSYFRCDENDRSGCKVLKRTQRCSPDEEYVMYTYLGRHTHHP